MELGAVGMSGVEIVPARSDRRQTERYPHTVRTGPFLSDVIQPGQCIPGKEREGQGRCVFMKTRRTGPSDRPSVAVSRPALRFMLGRGKKICMICFYIYMHIYIYIYQ